MTYFQNNDWVLQVSRGHLLRFQDGASQPWGFCSWALADLATTLKLHQFIPGSVVQHETSFSTFGQLLEYDRTPLLSTESLKNSLLQDTLNLFVLRGKRWPGKMYFETVLERRACSVLGRVAGGGNLSI